MANRYWVGGTASWDGTAGTKWAATSGGPGGETVPTTADDVFFTSASTGTVSIVLGNTGAKSINCTGFTGTIAGTGGISVAGSVTLVAGMTYSNTGIITIIGTGTLTTAGHQLGGLTINGSGIVVTLGAALTLSGIDKFLNITQGTFETANFTVTIGFLSSTNANSRTISLGSSTVDILGGGASINFTTSTNLTFNAGTSQINLTSTSSNIDGGNQTFYNVSFTASGIGTRGIGGANTFNNLTLTAPGPAGLAQLVISGNPVVTGTFTCTGATALRRTFLRSDTIGTTRTITAAAISAADCDFRDITLAGAAAGAAPTRAGDCGGNSGITFPAAKTVYRVGTNATWAGSASWALTSGAAGADNNFPLAQDTAVINNDTTLTGTLALATLNIGSLDCSSRTTAITLLHGAGALALWHGSYVLGTGVTVSGTTTQTFCGRNAIMDITTAGKTIPFFITVDAPSGTFRLADSFTGSSSINLTRGTFNANNFNLSCLTFVSNNTNVRTITMGSGLWTLTSTGDLWIMASITNLTFNKNTANILLANNTTTSRRFVGGGLSYNKLTIGGDTSSSVTTLANLNSFTELASTKTVSHTVRFQTDQNIINTWSISGTLGNVVTVDATIPSIRQSFTLTNVATNVDYLSVKDIGELSDNKFYVGANSVNGGNNDNVYFSAPLFNVGNMFAMFASA